MARAFTFIHTADLHLDAPFQGIDARDERVRETLVESTYRAFERIVSLAEERAVDFVLIAGDAYNSRDKSLRAQLRFRAAIERLDAAGIPVYLVQGNHDPADGWSARLKMPANLHVFPTNAVERVEVADAAGDVLCALYGRGFATAATRTNLASGFRRDPADETAIGVLHANVGGQTDYEPYAPCSLDDLRAANMDYWALGHIHKPLDLPDEPRVRYPGSPQGLNPKEDGAHGCWLVTMERGRITAEEFVETSSVVWARRELEIATLADLDDLRTGLRALCADVLAQAGERPAIARIDLVGRGEVHAELARGEVLGELVSELRDEMLAGSPWLWIDRVRDLTRPALDVAFLREVEDFTGDLVRIADEVAGDPSCATAFVDAALADVDGAFGTRERDVAALLELARDACLDRLLAGEER